MDGNAIVVPSCLLYAIRGSPRLEVERDGVSGGEGLDGADPCGPPVVLNGVTVASYLGRSLPDAHIHSVTRVLEPGVGTDLVISSHRGDEDAGGSSEGVGGGGRPRGVPVVVSVLRPA